MTQIDTLTNISMGQTQQIYSLYDMVKKLEIKVRKLEDQHKVSDSNPHKP